jgi:hypothetical protein
MIKAQFLGIYRFVFLIDERVWKVASLRTDTMTGSCRRQHSSVTVHSTLRKCRSLNQVKKS